MRFIVFGAGALGSLFGGILSRKNEVLLVGRHEHVKEINNNGLKISGMTEFVAHPEAVTNIEKHEDADLVVLTVKAYDTRSAVEEIADKCECPILSIQNGIGNEEIISKIAGEDRTIGGITTHGVRYISPGNIIHTGKGETIIGEIDGSISERIREYEHAMTECGIETIVSKNIKAEIWRKAIVNASINPLTAVLKCKNGYLLENENARTLMEKICREGEKAAKSNGIEVGDVMKKVEEVANMTRENHSSMLQSLMRGKRTEIEQINGELVRAGREKGIEMPANSFLVELVKAMENAAVAP